MEYTFDFVSSTYSQTLNMTVIEHSVIADEIFDKQPVLLQVFLALNSDSNIKEPYLSSVFRLMSFLWMNIKNSPKIKTKITEDDLEEYSINTEKMLEYFSEEEDESILDTIYDIELIRDSRKYIIAVVYQEIMNTQEAKKIDLHTRCKIFFYLLPLINCITEKL